MYCFSDFFNITSVVDFSIKKHGMRVQISIVITSQRSERSSNLQSYMVRLNDIQIALQTCKKLKQGFITILGSAESFETMNQPNAARPSPTVTHFNS